MRKKIKLKLINKLRSTKAINRLLKMTDRLSLRNSRIKNNIGKSKDDKIMFI